MMLLSALDGFTTRSLRSTFRHVLLRHLFSHDRKLCDLDCQFGSLLFLSLIFPCRAYLPRVNTSPLTEKSLFSRPHQHHPLPEKNNNDHRTITTSTARSRTSRSKATAAAIAGTAVTTANSARTSKASTPCPANNNNNKGPVVAVLVTTARLGVGVVPPPRPIGQIYPTVPPRGISRGWGGA